MESETTHENLKLFKPTLYLCAGVSGAGCTTAVENISALGLAKPGPGQIASRNARTLEIHAGNKNNPNLYRQYYFVKPDKMDRARKFLVLHQEKYQNTYGFTRTAIERIRKTLTTSNVIIDALGLKSDWQKLLHDAPIITLYFAPENLAITRERITQRMLSQKGEINKPEMESRLKANSENLDNEIFHYDYWIDTTDLREIVPAVSSVIKLTSHGEIIPLHSNAISVATNPERITNLIKNYQTTN